jgi:hypothetical protein
MTQPVKFLPGRIAATPGVLAKAEGKYLLGCLRCHIAGDWGLVCPADAQANEDALVSGARILSVYPLPNDPDKLWVITEATDYDGKRSLTTFLLPSEY